MYVEKKVKGGKRGKEKQEADFEKEKRYLLPEEKLRGRRFGTRAKPRYSDIYKEKKMLRGKKGHTKKRGNNETECQKGMLLNKPALTTYSRGRAGAGRQGELGRGVIQLTRYKAGGTSESMRRKQIIFEGQEQKQLLSQNTGKRKDRKVSSPGAMRFFFWARIQRKGGITVKRRSRKLGEGQG